PVTSLPARAGPHATAPPTPPTATALPPVAPTIIVEPDPPAALAPLPVVRPVEPAVVAAVPVSSGLRLPSWEVVLLGVWVIGTVAYIGVAVVRVRRFTRLL